MPSVPSYLFPIYSSYVLSFIGILAAVFVFVSLMMLAIKWVLNFINSALSKRI